MKKTQSLKEVFNNLYLNEVNSKEYSNQAMNLFKDAASKPVKWTDIYRCTTDFWNSLRSKDKLDETATEMQAAFVVPLIVTYITVLQTDMMMGANTLNIVSNHLSNLFKSQEHVDAAKEILETLNAYESEDFDIRREKFGKNSN